MHGRRTGVWIWLLCVFGLVLASPSRAKPVQGDAGTLLAHAESDTEIEVRLRQFEPAPIGVAAERLTPRDLKLLGKLIEAADWLDRVFWEQVSDVGRPWYESLLAEGGQRATRLARLMAIHYGPWDRLRDNQEFIGSRSRPDGAGFYPSDASRRELDAYLSAHPEEIGTLMGPLLRGPSKGGRLRGDPLRGEVPHGAVPGRDCAA